MKKQYISDIIGESDIFRWKLGDSIFISAPTGSGKSYFIKHRLVNFGSKILLISNRNLLKRQNDSDIGECESIVTKNYQSLEFMSKESFDSFLDKFDILVFDEIHYILSDAMFNRNTDLFLDILKHGSNSKICIFITATPEAIFSIRTHYTYIYSLDSDYGKNISKLYFYKGDESLRIILDRIPENERCIYFSSSAERAFELHSEYHDSSFICSENNNKFFKKSSVEEISNIVNLERFNSKYLFTTKVLDSGINLKDKTLKHVILDIADPITFIQCLGRKRIVDDEKITLYVKNYHGGQLSGYSRELSKKIDLVHELTNVGKQEFLNRYRKKYVDDVIDIGLEVNWAKYYSYLYLQDVYCNMMKDDAGIGYKRFICNKLNISIDDALDAEKYFFKNSFEDFLNFWLEKEMYCEDQNRFKTNFFEYVFKTRCVNYRNRGLKSINAIIEEDGYAYKLISRICNCGENRKKTYWKLLKL